MTVAIRGECTGGNNGGTSTAVNQTLTLPAGCVAGDILLVVADVNSGTVTTSTPAGFTKLSGPDTNGSTNHRTYLFAKDLTSSDITAGTVTVTWSATTGIKLAAGLVLSGAAGWGVSAVQINPSSGSSITMPSVTAGSSGSRVVQFVCTRNSGGVVAVPTTPTGWTRGNNSANGGSSVVLAIYSYIDDTDTTAGSSYGGESVSLSASGQATGYTLEITPPAASSPWQVFNGSAWQPATMTVTP